MYVMENALIYKHFTLNTIKQYICLLIFLMEIEVLSVFCYK